MLHDDLIATGRYRARYARAGADMDAALALRARMFRSGAGGDDRDTFDELCRHVLIEEVRTGQLVGCYRVMVFEEPGRACDSYAAQFYDLGALQTFPLPMLELGRFCVAPEARSRDVLLLAWAGLTRIVDGRGVGLLFGCSSFEGTDPSAYRDSFALLRAEHRAPEAWAPRRKAAEIVQFGSGGTAESADALRETPPLLRTYLEMGGWVSDHAVVDRDLGTLHVFTGLEVAGVPAARARMLRALAARGR